MVSEIWERKKSESLNNNPKTDSKLKKVLVHRCQNDNFIPALCVNKHGTGAWFGSRGRICQ